MKEAFDRLNDLNLEIQLLLP